ncbi:MAG TPA: hypothetical protein VK543_11490 [Puia sp.]|nr:hypothetical protein [Puia sp.]
MDIRLSLVVLTGAGIKAEAFFDKYFTRQFGMKYISLPSTSPANTGTDFDSICKSWQRIIAYI